MKPPNTTHWHILQDKAFLLLLGGVSVAFAWMLWPFYGAVFWAVVLAILFAPLYQVLVRSMRERRTAAAFATLFIILVIVILPLAAVSASLVREALGVYARIQAGELNPGRYFRDISGILPTWLTQLLERFGLSDLSAVQDPLLAAVTKSAQFLAGQAVNIGQNTFEFIVSTFIMLYLLFFLLRDGNGLLQSIREATPLDVEVQRKLSSKFIGVVRATVKGNVVVAILQGALGGLILWVLDIRAPVFWGVVMAFLSLLPAVGTALVWFPIAVYFFVTGAVWQGVALIAYGVLVIGLVDNIVRPILVGKDTRMPDYVVLISTLGGMAMFGINGFLIGPMIAAIFIAAWDTVATSKTVLPPADPDQGV